MQVDIIAPVFNEERGLSTFFEQTCQVLNNRPEKFQFIFVNDGSTDHSLQVLLNLKRSSVIPVKVVDLSRNFGHSEALTAGIFAATGDAIIIMDADLEDPPELIPELLEEFKRGRDVVYTVKTGRIESPHRKVLFYLFHFLFSRLTNLSVPEGSGAYSLMGRKFVEEFKKLGESNRFIPGLRSYVGMNAGHVYFKRGARLQGASKQGLKRLSELALNAFFLFSHAPLWVGPIYSLVAFSALLYFLIFTSSAYKLEVGLIGFFLIMVMKLLTINVIISHKAQVESLKRPLYIVKNVYE